MGATRLVPEYESLHVALALGKAYLSHPFVPTRDFAPTRVSRAEDLCVPSIHTRAPCHAPFALDDTVRRFHDSNTTRHPLYSSTPLTPGKSPQR
jgi:hypothetical protein